MRSSSQKVLWIVGLYTDPPPDSTVLCVDELALLSACAFPPAPGWSQERRRIRAPLQYSRGSDKAWVFGARFARRGRKRR